MHERAQVREGEEQHGSRKRGRWREVAGGKKKKDKDV